MAMAKKKCPECAELVLAEARVCRFCGHRWSDGEVSAALEEIDRNVPKRASMWIASLAIGLVGAIVLLLVLVQGSSGEPTPSETPKGASRESEIDGARILVERRVPEEIVWFKARYRKFPESLEVLVAAKKLTEKQLVDPWGKPLVYEAGPDDFRLCSFGPDQVLGTPDDICRGDE